MDKKKALEEKIRFQVECEKTAHLTVQRLLDNPVTEDFLIDSGRLIKPEHYDDVIEERAISHQCGYPVCSNSLANVPKQRFHISTRTNKVYDIQQRKNFCSNECYNASNYYKSQLSTSPLWMRKNQKIPTLMLLSKPEARGKCGEEVVSIAEEIRAEVRILEKPVKTESNEIHKSLGVEERDEDLVNNDTDGKKKKEDTEEIECSMGKMMISDQGGCNESSPSKDIKKSVSKSKSETDSSAKMATLMSLLDRRKNLLGKIAQIENVSASSAQSGSRSKTDGNVTVIKHKDDGENKSVMSSQKDHNSSPGKDNVTKTCIGEHQTQTHAQTQSQIHKIPDVVAECVSVASTNAECKDTETKPELQEPKAPKNIQQKNSKIQTQTQKAPSVSVLKCICDILKTWITDDTREFLRVDTKANSVPEDSELSERRMTSLENEEGYKRLCRKLDTGETELDLQEDQTVESDNLPHDYQRIREEVGNFAVKVQQFYGGKSQTENVVKEKSTPSKTPVYLPSVDSHDQMLIRQKIVMERLHKVTPEFLSPLQLSIQDVFSPLRQLVSTFRLGSKNISFKPAQWTLIALLLLKMLSCRELKIACAFTGTSAIHFFTIMLQGVGESLENTDVYVTHILKQ